jgi:hypothetical protein
MGVEGVAYGTTGDRADYWKTDAEVEAAKTRLKAAYKEQMQGQWAKLHSEWDDLKRNRESWDAVRDLWGGRYGTTNKLYQDAEGVYRGEGEHISSWKKSADAGAAVDMAYSEGSATYGHGSRAGIATKMVKDPFIDIDNIQTGAELAEFIVKYGVMPDAWHPGGVPSMLHAGKGIALKVLGPLKGHLRDTAENNDKAGSPSLAHSSLTGDLLTRAAAEVKKAASPPAPKDTTAETLSRAGIAYDTVEYREQCFLLSQVFKIVEHKIEVIDEEEHKYLPYVDEGATTEEGEKVRRPSNACLMVDALTPYGFINRLTQYPEQQKFINLSTPDLSQLQPQIRLFRVAETTDDSTGQMVETSKEIVFNTSTTRQDLEEFMKPTGKRGFGAGIKNFSVNYEASNPFALKKSISAELTIFANTFDELTTDRGGYSYIDLALKTGGYSTMEKYTQKHGSDMSQDERNRLYNLSKLNFRLKAVVGWMKPPGIQGLSNPQGIADMLNTSFVTINLTPTIHTFDFDEMGRVIFKIQYLAYIDDFFDEPSYSIFSDSTIIENQKNRESIYRKFQENCESEELAKYKEKMAADVAKELAQARAAMWKDLKNSGKLRFINLKYSSLREFQEKGPYFDLLKAEADALDINNLRDATAGQRNGLARAIKEYSKNPTAKGHGHKDKKNANSTQQIALVYFYISDLLDIILKGIDDDLETTAAYHRKIKSTIEAPPTEEDQKQRDAHRAKNVWEDWHAIDTMKEEFKQDSLREAELDLRRTLRMQENFKRYRCLLGPIEIVDPRNPANSACVNIGDLPISFKYFMEWLTGRTLSKDRPYYAISAFLNDFINGLVNGFINDGHCFPRGRGQSKQKTFLMQAAVTAYNKRANSYDTISQMLSDYRVDTKDRTSYDVARLHLHYHNAADMTGVQHASNPIKSWPVLEMSGPPGSPISVRDTPYEINYVCYYAGRTAPNEKMNGIIGEDTPNGIMHYTAGKDRGIVKNIKFQKTETPGLKEVRYEQEGYNGLEQMREVYNVTINTYANVSAFPGSYIFVNPRGLVPNMTFNAKVSPGDISAQELSTYGIGGYYMIIRSSHKFGAGEANTTINATWVSEIAKKKEDKEKKKVDKKEKKEKCQYLKKANNIASKANKDKKNKEPKDNVSKKK